MVLNQLHIEKEWVPQKLPYEATIEIKSIQKRETITSYIKHKFWPKLEYGPEYTPNGQMPLLVVISIILVILLISIIGYFIKQRKSQILQPFRGNTNKQYDVFISYSNLDKEFVEDFMVPNLEVAN